MSYPKHTVRTDTGVTFGDVDTAAYHQHIIETQNRHSKRQAEVAFLAKAYAETCAAMDLAFACGYDTSEHKANIARIMDRCESARIHPDEVTDPIIL